ncbi:Holliday junction branch migration protein RuvA [Tissierella creatinophila]|uniref:Holliday junction branch migration complex subunit RuvA n=1 Tax=Tissierella creatinophila DSM 6911 TaxID=1123403 RepID=A0A1U7M311_TISCR|nr:Holliday junction branch migration protein RuvA [Tissierella creatinophila]OLS01665.1 holliday junction ATP-dependent DNA helicase RuvA [Tissierella creatinophila DSM 6911]
MIEFIIGDIVDIKEDFTIIQNNNIGYKVFSSSNSLRNLEIGKKNQMIYTQLNVREDGLFLFGFITEEEMEMFNLLLRVSKIGPKIGIGILSALNPNQLKLAIMNKDIFTLCKAPGIGKKTAERIVLELKDRIDINIELEIENINSINNGHDEAIEALISLGYSRFEVERSIRNLDVENMEVEEIIRNALKKLSKN